MSPGVITHLGISNYLIAILGTLKIIPDITEFDFKFDGVQAFENSTQGTFWFITGCIVGGNFESFIAGIFLGLHKPTSANKF